MELITNLSLVCFAIIAFMPFSGRPLAEPDPLSGRRISYAGFFMFAFSFAIIFTASFRMGFIDTGTYKGLYTMIGTDFNNAFNDTITIDDKGFNLLMVLLNRISPDPQLLVIVTSVFSYGIYMYTLNKYSSDLPFALLLFFCTGFFSAMNGIRQVVASGLMLLAIPLLMKKKTWAYLLVMWLCTTLHASAYVMIPLYFALSGKRLNKGVWIMVGLTGLCFVFPNLATTLMGEILEDSTYKEYLNVDSQMSMMRFLVELVPILITLAYCFIQRGEQDQTEHTSDSNHRLIDVLINMQIVSFCFTTLGLRMVYFARITLYFPCVLPLLLPVTLKEIFTKESASFAKTMAIIMYLIFFGYQTYTYYNQGYFWDFYLNI